MIIGCGFIGCASHRFNLAVKDLAAASHGIVTKVHTLMGKLRFLIAAAKLRSITPLKAKCAIETRWRSVYQMLRRFKEIRECIPKLEVASIDDLFPTRAEIREADSLLSVLSDLDSVTKELQKKSLTISEAQVLFNAVVAKFESTRTGLGEDASIVLQYKFESRIRKLQEGRTSELTQDETEAVEKLKRDERSSYCSGEEGTESTLAERALKRHRAGSSSTESLYKDSRFVLPTSNICERRFSKAVFALNDRRRGILPCNFEAEMFLHVNARYWGIQEVQRIMD